MAFGWGVWSTMSMYLSKAGLGVKSKVSGYGYPISYLLRAWFEIFFARRVGSSASKLIELMPSPNILQSGSTMVTFYVFFSQSNQGLEVSSEDIDIRS
jgi:hypothetical protein